MIYFVQGERSGLIKIGHSESLKQRLRKLQVASPERLHVLAVMEGARDDEEALHKRFSDARSHGEWFHPRRDLVRFIERLNIAGRQDSAQARITRRRSRLGADATRKRIDALYLAADQAGMTARDFLLSVALPAIAAAPSDDPSTFTAPVTDGGRGA